MGQPGILMRFVMVAEGGQATPGVLDAVLPLPGIQAIYSLDAHDAESPSHNTMYFLEDVGPVLENEDFYLNDKQNGAAAQISWVIMSFINGRDSATDPAKSQLPRKDPPSATSVVVNGSTPSPDKEQDYHDWYDQEHAGKLALVPGWQLARRYKFRKQYGEVETASFYGVNFYDEVNGLGGPEWRAGVTDWTLRIRAQAAKPNVRRVWKLQGVKRV